MTTNEIDALRDKLDRAEKLSDKGEYAQAEQLANEVLALSDEKGLLPKDTALAHCILGDCFRLASRYDEAITNFQTGLAASEAALDLSLQARSLTGIATIEISRGNNHDALHTAEIALEIAERAEDLEIESKVLNILGVINMVSGNYAIALDCLTRALRQREELGRKDYIASTLCNIGSVHCHQGAYYLSIECLVRGLALAEEADDREAMCPTLGNIGSAYFALGDYSHALEYYTRALRIAEEVGYKTDVASNLASIGRIHFALDDRPRILDYFSRSLSIAEDIGDPELVAECLNCIAFLYMEEGNYSTASEYLNRAIDLNLRFGNMAENIMLTNAVLQRKLGNLDTAYRGFMDSLHRQREMLKSDANVADTLLRLGGVLIEQVKIEEALISFEEGLRVAVKLGQKAIAMEAHRNLADGYAKLGELAKENEHLKKHYALKEEIFNEKTRQQVDTFNIRVAIANQERDTKLARLETEQSKRETEVQQLRAEQSEQQLSNSTLHLLAQTELLSDLRSDLIAIVRKFPGDGSAREIRERVKNLPCQSIDWGKFDTQFKAAHPDFVKKLIEAHADLSPMEVRVCTLIRMNLKSEEIARLFCVTERAVEFHRLNIRKKLDLGKKDNLSMVLAKM